MLGLCHRCLSSNVEVSITKGFVHCGKCPSTPLPKEDMPDYRPILPFEDLPFPKPEERSLYAYKIAHEIFDKQFNEKMAQDREFDKRY